MQNHSLTACLTIKGTINSSILSISSSTNPSKTKAKNKKKKEMAISQIHFRSISLPSRLHPINSPAFEAEFQKLKSCQTCPVSSETIQSGLLGLAELYNSIQEHTQHNQDGKSIEESLESSIELLDSCTAIRELVQMLRENVQALQSGLRRKGVDPAINDDVSSYFSLRKKMNKCIAKSMKAIKNMENKNGSSNLITLNDLTLAIFKSVLIFLSSPTAKIGGWNLISKMIVTKSDKDCGVISEVGCVDLALKMLQSSKVVDVQMLKTSLRNLDSSAEAIEAGLERLFRQLLQTRVTLLNILTDH